MSEPNEKPVVFDDDNPEWTAEDFARAKPVSDHPVLAKAFPRTRGAQKAPTKVPVSIRLDPDVLAKFRALGAGWQTRVNEILRKARV
jgi:uncharacterized protein (DUF4415 family)